MGFWHDLTAKSGGLFGGPTKQAAARLAEWLLMARLQANDINRPKRHCRIGRVTLKAPK